MAMPIFRMNHAMMAKSSGESSYLTFTPGSRQSEGNSARARFMNEYDSVVDASALANAVPRRRRRVHRPRRTDDGGPSSRLPTPTARSTVDRALVVAPRKPRGVTTDHRPLASIAIAVSLAARVAESRRPSVRRLARASTVVGRATIHKLLDPTSMYKV